MNIVYVYNNMPLCAIAFPFHLYYYVEKKNVLFEC